MIQASRLQRSLVVILNPTAGARKKDLLDLTLMYLKVRGWRVDVFETEGAGDAKRFVADYRGDASVVVAAGGDGTVNEVINGLAQSSHPRILAIIPLGTTNVIARELDLPLCGKALAELIDGQQIKECYWPRLNDRCFAFSVGVGFDAQVVESVNLDLKKQLGKLAYAIAALKPLLNFGRNRYRVLADGKEYQARSVLVSNGRFYAGRFVIAAGMRLQYPEFQLLLIHARTPWSLLVLLLSLPFNRFENSRHVTSVRTSMVMIEGESPIESLQVDGDSSDQLPLTILSTTSSQSVICG